MVQISGSSRRCWGIHPSLRLSATRMLRRSILSRHSMPATPITILKFIGPKMLRPRNAGKRSQILVTESLTTADDAHEPPTTLGLNQVRCTVFAFGLHVPNQRFRIAD